MPMKTCDKDAVVIGGGISGLATAYRLKRAGLKVLLLEKSGRVGGAVQTERAGDFLIDYGPNSTLETSPKIRNFITEIGLANARIEASAEAKRRYILKSGQLHALPMSPPQFIASRLFSGKAKLRLLAEPFISPAPDDKEETVAEFVERRLGREILDYAVNPFVAGVFAGDPEKLSVASALSKLHALEKNYGGLIKGAVRGARARKKSPETAKPKARLFSFHEGMGQLTDTLASILSEEISTLSPVQAVDLSPSSAGHTVTFARDTENVIVKARTLVFTTPAFVTANLLSAVSPSLAVDLNELSYPPVAVVFFGFSGKAECRALDGFGFLVPKVESRSILGTIWSSALFPNRAPQGGMALTTFLDGSRQPEVADLQDEALSETVWKELNQIMSLDMKPDVVKIKRWPRAIPQYELGHAKKMARIEAFEEQYPGIFISGNFRNGISLGDCIVSSERVAEKVTEYCRFGEDEKVPSHSLASVQ